MLYIHMTVRYPSQRHGTKIKFDHSSHIAESIRGTNRVSLWTDDDDDVTAETALSERSISLF